MAKTSLHTHTTVVHLPGVSEAFLFHLQLLPRFCILSFVLQIHLLIFKSAQRILSLTQQASQCCCRGIHWTIL